MKKFLALALTLTLALALSISAFAYTYGGETGTATAPNGDTQTNLSIVATATTVESRYAIDIQYENMQVNVVASKMYWDAKDLEYKVANDGSTTPSNTEATIKVENRSDQSIWYSFVVNDLMSAGDNDDGITFNASKAQGDENRHEIGKATPKAGDQPGVTITDTFTVTSEALGEGGWTTVANFYASYFKANPSPDPEVPATKDIATITISFWGSAS